MLDGTHRETLPRRNSNRTHVLAYGAFNEVFLRWFLDYPILEVSHIFLYRRGAGIFRCVGEATLDLNLVCSESFGGVGVDVSIAFSTQVHGEGSVWLELRGQNGRARLMF